MAKTSKQKNGQPARNSRAARRANSPALQGNIDKSLLSLPRPSTASRSVLAPNAASGVAKRSGRKARMTRTQRIRHEKGITRADSFREQLDAKVVRSGEKEKRVKDRRKRWEDINDKMSRGAGGHGEDRDLGRFDVLAESQDMDIEETVATISRSKSLIEPKNVPTHLTSGHDDVSTGGTTSSAHQQDKDEIL